MRDRTRGRVRQRIQRSVAALLLITGMVGWLMGCMTHMPGESFRGPLPSATQSQRMLAELLRADVGALSVQIGPRHVGRPDALDAAADFIRAELRSLGLDVSEQAYNVGGVACRNLSVDVTGSVEPASIVLVGAHYDTQGDSDTPGANDNASGVAAALALARHFADTQPRRTFRLVFFANEEPPWFWTDQMGSVVYARAARARGDDIAAMIALDGIGCYLDEPGTQQFVAPLGLMYPSTGNFIAFVSNLGSRPLLHRCIGTFRRTTDFPSEGLALPGWLPHAGLSDHWSFWQQDYPAVLVTDTLPFRYAHYHRATDAPDQLDFGRMARVTEGLTRVIDDLLNGAGHD